MARQEARAALVQFLDGDVRTKFAHVTGVDEKNGESEINDGEPVDPRLKVDRRRQRRPGPS